MVDVLLDAGLAVTEVRVVSCLLTVSLICFSASGFFVTVLVKGTLASGTRGLAGAAAGFGGLKVLLAEGTWKKLRSTVKLS